MAKLKVSILGRRILGTIGDIVTFDYQRKTQILKKKPFPTDPRTPAQLAQRDKFNTCVLAWHDLDPDDKQDWITKARGYPNTALGLFMTMCLMAPATATMHGHWPGVQAPGANVIVRFFTPGTQTEVYKAAAATDASGYFDITTVPPGTYDVGVKTDAALSELTTNQTFTAGATTNVAFNSWRGGDLNNSDKVDGVDYSILSGNYNDLGACKGYPGNWLMP